MRWPLLACLLMLPGASAEHTYQWSDDGDAPPPDDIRAVHWATSYDGHHTSIALDGVPVHGNVSVQILVLAGDAQAQAWHGTVQPSSVAPWREWDGNATDSRNAKLVPELYDGNQQPGTAIQWNPPLAEGTCVRVAVALQRDGVLLDQVPDAPVAPWDLQRVSSFGPACDHRHEAWDVERWGWQECDGPGHPSVPVYCSPSPAAPLLLAGLGLVALAVRARRTF